MVIGRDTLHILPLIHLMRFNAGSLLVLSSWHETTPHSVFTHHQTTCTFAVSVTDCLEIEMQIKLGPQNKSNTDTHTHIHNRNMLSSQYTAMMNDKNQSPLTSTARSVDQPGKASAQLYIGVNRRERGGRTGGEAPTIQVVFLGPPLLKRMELPSQQDTRDLILILHTANHLTSGKGRR